MTLRLSLVTMLLVYGFTIWAQTSPPSEIPPALPPPAPPEVPQVPSMMSPDGTINEEGVLFQPTDGYSYDLNNRRDPFKPYGQSQTAQAPNPIPNVEDAQNQGNAPDLVPQIPLEPLQMYDVSQFKLMGIIWQVRTPKAVVKDPVGKQHIVYKNTKIGRNNGFIASIREGEIIIVEPTVTENGMPSAITRVLNLKK